MNILDRIKNKTIFANKYHTDSEAVIVSCFFNPQNSYYRTQAFKIFYESIKHLNHYIIECVIGDALPELEENEHIKRIYTKSLLWHKESLINKAVSELPEKYRYIFWLDADVIFKNLDWMVEGVEQLQEMKIIQPFEYCVHLEKDETEPSFSMERMLKTSLPNKLNNKVWRSFCANYTTSTHWQDKDYNTHGHVGFAWAARREVLDEMPLYDKALIGGADHIIAHAAAGQIPHDCITKSFTDNIEEVNAWSERFFRVVRGDIGYVIGELYHIWHGDIVNRQYLKRIQDFTVKTKEITERDKNGLYVSNENHEKYMSKYFDQREVTSQSQPGNDGFVQSMMIGYMTDSTVIGAAVGGNVVGAMIGDMLNDNNNAQNIESATNNSPNTEFGGGEFGGAGAGGTWEDNSSANQQSDNSNASDNPFS